MLSFEDLGHHPTVPDIHRLHGCVVVNLNSVSPIVSGPTGTADIHPKHLVEVLPMNRKYFRLLRRM
jgi:hypothetical protein